MNSALMFSKASDEWGTPLGFWNSLDDEFHFGLDAAAASDNNKCDLYFGLDRGAFPAIDALGVEWSNHGAVWLNPPYSKCREFIAKAAKEAAKGCTVVCLVPSRTDTRWWHEHVWDRDNHRPKTGVEVRFIKGRLKFGGAECGAPFPSVVIVFRPQAAS